MTKGRCFCGSVQFEVEGAPLWRAVCHCESCRRATSSPLTAFVGFPREAVKWSGGVPAEYQHSERATRLFCPKCGSQLAYVSASRTDQIDLYTASLEDPDAFAPEKSAFEEEALAFTRHLSDLPEWK
ncbi:GFA family protein [Ponticaulis sp.]|uniref:GFA family protein n=1 Tax=Ponticaulis sp. TaxID=2020902 RepID=UPI000B759D42|nr:GFA family protein [Ponticaulis sp.]MAI89156.1 aldehyde-activating protein [Ponticaulis sp.]OUY01153.1 MAG: hypothetical protein CBB65_01565 [Hyphomonadaceae bacterium TMED5]